MTVAHPFDLIQVLTPRRRFVAALSISAGTMLLIMDASIATVGLPNIARDLGIQPSESVLVMVIYNLVLAMTLMPFAALGIRLGLRRLFLGGVCAYMIGAGLSWFADSFYVLLLTRAIQALGAASALSVSSALVRAIYPPQQLGRGLGINTLAGATGASLAPALGGIIVSHASWHWVFVAGVPLGVAAFVAGSALPETPRNAERFDSVGAILCAITFGLAIFGLQTITRQHHAVLPILLLGVSTLLAFVFVRHESREQHPVLPLDLLRNPIMLLSVAAALTGYLASTFMIIALPFRLHAAGFTAAEIGAVLMPYAITTTICAPTSGMLSDRFPPAALGTLGLIVATIALLLLYALPASPTHFQVAWPAALCGAGFGFFMPPNARLIIGAAPPGRAAPASSLISTTACSGRQ
ncbi:MAG TPA: MFS transporter [Steroidobacteraceae bacterium]|nr:MFS transporter [Steroidobacteraceae bacterium]